MHLPRPADQLPEEAGGRTAHALYYPPTNAGFAAPVGEQPPLIVQAHGGPTAGASPAFGLSVQYWTSRGFALVGGVDYAGSSGCGRAYRRLLDGQWGVVDVEDVIAAVRHLADAGQVDPRRVAIHGGSAGGFTVLAALSQSDHLHRRRRFLYGVAEPRGHKPATPTSSRKPLPRRPDRPLARGQGHPTTPAPRSNHLDGFSAPLLILQGAEDPIVYPQPGLHDPVDALRAKGTPVAMIEFAGEGHGFRRAENIIRAKEAEKLYFYGQVFGF